MRSWARNAWAVWQKVDPALSFAGYVYALVGTTAGAAVIAWATTQLGAFWAELGLPGVAYVFLFVWLVIALAIFLTGYGVAAWRGRHGPSHNRAGVPAVDPPTAQARYAEAQPQAAIVGDLAIRQAIEDVVQRLNRNILAVLADFRQSARDGALVVWGRPNGSQAKPREKIPPEHWRDFDFNAIQCLYQDNPNRCHTMPDDANSMRHDERYSDLWVNKLQVDALWPTPAIRHAADPEIDRIRRDVHALADRLCNHEVYEDQRDDLVDRYKRIEASDHLMWSTDPLKQLRRDFLNRCGWAMANGKWYDSAEERNDSQAEILRLAAEIDAAVAGR